MSTGIAFTLQRRLISVPTIGLMVISGLSLGLGVLREASVAHALGASWGSDSFYTANLPVLLLIDLGTDLSIALVPVFVGIGIAGAASEFILRRMLLSGIAIAALVSVTSPWWVDALLAPAPHDVKLVARSMVWVLFPAMALVFTTGALKARANAGNRFLRPALAGLMPSILVVLGSMMTWRLGPLALSIAFGVGLILQWILLRTSNDTPSASEDPGLRPGFYRAILVAWSFVVAGALFTKIEPVVQRALAAQLGAGTISAVFYAQKMAYLPNAVITMGIATVAFPEMARRANTEGSRKFLLSNAAMVACVLLPLSAALWLSSGAVVRLVFEHGAFNEENSVLVASLLRHFCFGIFPLGISIVLARFLTAVGLAWTYAVAGLVAAICYACVVWPATRYFGAAGIVGASVLASWAQASTLAAFAVAHARRA